MKQITFMEKYPLFTLELNKNETKYKSVDEIIVYFKEKIEAHPVATYIATFDHYAHTKSLADGQINPDIQAAKNIVFCFGKELPKPEVMGVRPRSIGVADLGEKFVVSFLEAPNPTAHAAMEEWAKGLRS
ncbi:DUF6858 family protein [Nitratiruptor sp. YY09-18]|uniref:DUF6858 family protein n=1 Tax=Nitratiruptor sp. YY09-18 TaxID=2724901 RepID=UPI001915AD16|nr:hypothetical protein [Nitratiruptor sp. YY09-18]BCD67182.1 hypothetical protein NitYY0918_C0052 [Nitratiruptor sp. YY09-18]